MGEEIPKDNRTPTLEVVGLTKEYSGKRVVDEVSFRVLPGEIVALIGENGAGKSTVKNMISGLTDPTQGSILIEGVDVKNAHQKKVGTVHQELSLFSSLSAAENICISNLPGKPFQVDWAECQKIAKRYLDMVSTDIDLSTPVEMLSPGEQQLVEIAKALSTQPKLLLLDEPTASLSQPERDHLFDVMRTLRKQGVSIIFVTHFIDEVYAVSDRVVIMRNGTKVGESPISDIERRDMEELLVGRKLSDLQFEPVPRGEKVAMQVRDFSSDWFAAISFDLHEGEILGIAGLMGAGRTEIVETIFGLRSGSGTLTVFGKDYPKRSPYRMKNAGVIFIPEERRSNGIFPLRPLSENIAAAYPKETVKRRLIPGFGFRGLREKTRALADQLNVSYSNVNQPMLSLSGGNQQKAILARWMAKRPRICLFDDPTRGVDIGAKEEISNLIIRLASEGNSVILISSDTKELTDICHRIFVMNQGRFVSEVERGAFDVQSIIALAAASRGAGDQAGSDSMEVLS